MNKESAESGVVIVKKYANRRLYDTNASSYVTLEDLCNLVKAGVDFKVVDAKTDEDLTRSVLAQIIFEQESKGYNILPISFLRHIIGFYDDNLSAVLPAYLESMMENFSQNQDRMRSYMGGDLNDLSPIAQFNDISKKNMEMFESTMNMFNPFAAKDEDQK